MEDILLENPRGRRRSRRKARTASGRFRKSASNPKRRRRSRRRNPAGIVAPVSRKRRRRSRKGRATASRRKSGGRVVSMGGIRSSMMAGGALFGGELLGDLLGRLAFKVGASKILAGVKIPADYQAGVVRIGIGMFASPLLRLAGIPASIRQGFSAINVASGLIGLTYKYRQQAFASAGLSDYELAADMEDDDGDGNNVGDYELADDSNDPNLLGDAPPAGILGGDFSDQDYYGDRN